MMMDAEMLEALREFATSPENVFKEVFAITWTKLMNADRHDGSTGNACTDNAAMCVCSEALMPPMLARFASMPSGACMC